MSDWSAAVRKPPAYKVGSAGGEAECGAVARWGLGLGGVLTACFIAMLALLPHDGKLVYTMNRMYPFNPPVRSGEGTTMRIAVVTDLDHGTKSEDKKNTWFSYVRRGHLTIASDRGKASVKWDPDLISFTSQISAGGRGMELSDLKVFDGHLISVDDRTGILYRLDMLEGKKHSAVPWIILNDGPGNVTKGLKGEWMAVKEDELYVGGLGKEWTTITGEFVNHDPMWIKIVSPTGAVRHVDWVNQYKKLRAAAGINYPGYMIHESGQWSELHQRWVFLPRRASKHMYTEQTDEHAGTNLMILADESWESLEVRKIGPLIPTRGFSAFQFIPGMQDELLVALKSEEDDGTINSFITVFDIHGRVLLPESQLEGHFKYEGIEFI